MNALCLAVALALQGPPGTERPAPDGNLLVEVGLLADREAIRDGETLTLAVRLRIEPGWHVYWQNPGDSGVPTRAEIRGPEGFEIGPVRFPAPDRVELEGDIVSYVHTGELVLLADVRAPGKPARANEPASTTAEFSVECSWLVCTETCYAGSGKASVVLRREKADRPARPANEKLFAEARAKIPRPWKELSGATLASSRVPDDCATLAIRVPGARELEFYPLASDVLSLRSRVRAVDEAGAGLTLLYGLENEPADHPPLAAGVLRVKTAKGEGCYSLEAPLPKK